MLNHYLSLGACFRPQLEPLRHVGKNQAWDCILMQHLVF